MLKPQANTTRPQGHVRSWLDFRRLPTPIPLHQPEKTLLDP